MRRPTRTPGWQRAHVFGVALGLGAWAALAAWLPAAGQPARPGPDPAGPDAAETVRFWVPARGGYLAAWREAARRARARHPELAIAVEPIWADYGARLTLALAERQAPDLVVVPAALSARLAARGWLADVTDVVAPLRPPEAAAGPFTWRGRLYAVPGVLDPVLLYLNADVLAAAGVDPQAVADWEGLLQAARRTAASGRVRWATVVNGWPPLAMFVWQAGGAILEPPGQPWSDEAAVARAAAYYRTFIAEGLSPPAPASWAHPVDVPFRRGEAAFVMGLFSDPLEVAGAPSPFRPGEPPVAAGPTGPFAVRVLPVPAGPAGPVTWASVEGAAAPAPASPLALRALAYLAEALEAMGWQPPAPGRPEANLAAARAMPHARTLPPHPAFLEFDAAWWQHVVAPLLDAGADVDVRALLARARPYLMQALGQAAP